VHWFQAKHEISRSGGIEKLWRQVTCRPMTHAGPLPSSFFSIAIGKTERDGLSGPHAKSNRSKSILATIQQYKIREGPRLAAWHAR
jgi:hypothetical protein